MRRPGPQVCLFQTAMRRELSQRLGVEWGPIHHDSAEVAGIPARLLREFSQRTEQIAEWMEHRGVEGLDAKNQALLDTRPSKPTATDFASVEAEWRQRAEQLGWGPTELDQLLAASPRVAAGRRSLGDSHGSVDGRRRWISGPGGELR